MVADEEVVVARWNGGACPSSCEMLWFGGESGREMCD
jgi:hypothetical protein